MPKLIVNLIIPAEDYQRLYQGTVREVVARAVDGRRIRFPAHILRRFVTRDGIRGQFEIIFDETNRFESISCIG